MRGALPRRPGAEARPREASTGADVVLTCLMDDLSVLENATGEQGLLAAIAHGMGSKDWSGFYEITRMNAGLK